MPVNIRQPTLDAVVVKAEALVIEAEEGEKVRLIGHWDGEEEARWIGEEVEALQRGTRGMAAKSLDDMAILVRASHQMRAFEDRFLTIGLPYRVIGGPRFYERLEIRDAMAYFRLAVSQDDDLAFERIVNMPSAITAVFSAPIAISLGITQFGRVAGRYRRAFDELPSETLQRRSPRSTTPRHVTSRLAG